ncbi:hypothetical protein DSS3P1_72 [Ruegeria phage DSS3-P1]|uniref:hypothetical protein n=1 Tax=Ruegeria phage DSS3-P1 TaxID=1555208 RepID=UPI0002357D32|nr:hypothetical protein DSS3P1_72 [Ruegeria phage DSS3-P1]YP_009997289.1 hypothetical protein JT312_gp72 [Ruegeria phage vB_RpoS-V18]YP_009997371.1 hypothetical protein JT313_gp72 [Ruegeria phage vB_RpoS-V11]YP_009997455.1 hypothetical protein JT314_gp74 [Ruegeria phage vB_RpoS-V7]AET42284.1 hypothetical protein SDSG_00018 [Ruegeria phage DSS3-P1]AIT13307.1 hypothetical protein DSS3P1_72 [Ruegeria phage DSS3-P1]AWY08777.1 hypothetical protein vBRpoSV7_74 [Ruegeria phage vB_RpoS-V7]AWY08948.1
MFAHEITAKERKVAEELGLQPSQVCLVGSTLICGSGNDEDFLCLVSDTSTLAAEGYDPDIDMLLYDSPLQSWRKGSRNIIAVTDERFFLAEVAIAYAAREATRGHDLGQRHGRVAFHQTIREVVLHRAYDKTEDRLC